MERLGQFELEEKIADGGTASVWRGRQIDLDRPVAVKVLHPHLADDPEFVRRFQGEGLSIARLDHQNVVRVILSGREGPKFFIAMEYVDGKDLERWFSRNGAPPFEIALLMMRDIISGLAAAHAIPLWHRDIKPGNLMLARDGQLKITDFGLARHGDRRINMTIPGTQMGTPAYMSPEQAAGEEVDAATDVFSAGVVFYEMLSGVRPFPGKSYASVVQQIQTRTPQPVGELNPLVSPDLLAIVQRMLEKDRKRRFASMMEVVMPFAAVLTAEVDGSGFGLMREYAGAPQQVADDLRKRRKSRHLSRGLHFEREGQGSIEDALVEFRRARYLDPKDSTAAEHLKALEKRLAADSKPEPSPVPSSDTPTVPLHPPRRNRWRAILPWLLVLPAGGALWASWPWIERKYIEWKPDKVVLPDTVAVQPSKTIVPPSVPRVDKGFVQGRVQPAATFYLDGQRVARNVAVWSDSVTTGSHRLRVEHPLGGSREWELTVIDGQSVERNHDFTAVLNTPVHVRVVAPIWGNVVIDGARTEHVAPCRINLLPGRHVLSLERPGFRLAGAPKELRVRPGGEIETRLELEPTSP